MEGRIRNENLINVIINNCILNSSLALINLRSVEVSYTEENVFPIVWNNLLKSIKRKLIVLQKENQSFFISDCKEISFVVNENLTKKTGIYRRPYSFESENKVGYFLTNEEKEKFNVSLSLNYSANIEHKITKIINAKLLALSISGYSSGEVLVENSKIDNWYIYKFSTQLGANFYNISPFRSNNPNKSIEIKKSNLDKVWFDNISFDDYSLISFYRNKFGRTIITSCEFPHTYEGFDKFRTVEYIHYPDQKDRNYYKLRYETFLQLKNSLESSGNFYEAQKLQSVSKEALRNIEGLPTWDRFILRINKCSNNHGLSIKEPFIGTLFLSFVFYILYLLSLDRIFNSNEIDYNLIGYYFSFLDITHRSDFLVSKNELNGFSVTIDYLNKIVVGFLIYQFIAAFRKYGKK